MSQKKNAGATVEIMGEGFSLRPLERTDAAAITVHGNNIKIAQNMRDVYPFPYYLKDAENFLERVCGNTPATHFLIEIEKEAVGTFAAILKEDVYRYNAEIGYWLGEPFWGKGIMTKVIKTMLPYIFEQYLVSRIYAEVFSPNIGSMRALEKAGFKKEAVIRQNVFKNGLFLDTHVFALLKTEYVKTKK